MATTNYEGDEFNAQVRAAFGTPPPTDYVTSPSYRKKNLADTVQNTAQDDAYYANFTPEPPVPADVQSRADRVDAARSAAKNSTVPNSQLAKQISSPIMSKDARTAALAEATGRPGIADEFNRVLNQLKPQMETAIENRRRIAQEEADAEGNLGMLQSTKGELAAQVVRDQDAENKRKDADKYGFVALSGVDNSQADSVARQVTAANVQMFKTLTPLGDQIRGMQATSFLDNPIDWLNAQFQLPGLAGKYNAIAGKINEGDQFVKSQVALADAVNNANAGKLATKSTEEVERLAQQKVIDANISAQQAAINSAKLRGASEKEIQTIQDSYKNTIIALSQKEFNNTEQLLNDEERRKRNEETDLRKKVLMGELLSKEEAKRAALEEQKDKDARAANAASAIGMGGIKTFKDIEKMPAEKKKVLATSYASNGETIAKDPVELANVWKYVQGGLGDPNLRDSLGTLYTPAQRQLVKDALVQIQSEKDTVEKAGGKGEVLADTVNAKVTEHFTNMKNNPESGGKNFYSPPNLVEYSKNLPGNLAAIAAQETGPVAAKSGKAVDTAQILTTLSQQAAANSINVSKAAEDVVKMYSAIVKTTNDTMRFSRVGLPDQDNYMVKINNVSYDMLNAASVTRAMLKMRSAEFLDKYLSTSPPIL